MLFTVQFDTALQHHLELLTLVTQRLLNPVLTPLPVIAPEDRPDVGASAAPLPPLAAEDAPVPAPAPLPTPPVASPPMPAIDATGLPWDERIHSGTRTLNADGTWRQRRGINDPTLVARVEAELRGQVPSATAVPTPPLPTISAEAAAVPLPPAAANPASPMPTDFGALMARVAPLIVAGRVTREAIEACVQTLGAPSLLGLAGRADLIPQVAAAVDAMAGVA